MKESSREYASEAEVAWAAERMAALRRVLEEVVLGKEELIGLTLTGVLARGHLLLEGLPGLGKTELVKGLAKTLGLETRRIQFTPDLLPGDITGNPVLEETPAGRAFVFQRGPVFANLLLADEINRASPKTQSALLEAMQERRVTVLGTTHELPDPFIVLATQNPVELEGTYPLPEAQIDRFLFKLEVPRSDAATLERIVRGREFGTNPEPARVLAPGELATLLDLTRRIFLPDAVAGYVARLVDATHPGQSAAATGVKFGASPRAALGLAAAARARALLHGRLHAGFEDVRAIAPAVLGHRLIMDYEARISGRRPAEVVAALLSEVPAQPGGLPWTVRESTSKA